MTYAPGDQITLRADPVCGLPRQRAEVLVAYSGGLYDVRVLPSDRTRNDHDGLVTCTAKDIEGDQGN